jgi:hypothetical protein
MLCSEYHNGFRYIGHVSLRKWVFVNQEEFFLLSISIKQKNLVIFFQKKNFTGTGTPKDKDEVKLPSEKTDTTLDLSQNLPSPAFWAGEGIGVGVKNKKVFFKKMKRLIFKSFSPQDQVGCGHLIK